MMKNSVHSTQGFEWSNQWWICCTLRFNGKQSSYVANGEVLKANKYETSSKSPIQEQPLKKTTWIGNAWRICEYRAKLY